MVLGGKTDDQHVLGSRALRTTEVDGVPTFVVEAPTTPWVSLVFRTGVVDETLPTRGWTHLLEHLCLHDRDRPGLETNGSVGPLTTQFVASGDEEQVAGFLRDLCRWFADPDLSGVRTERDILRAEGRRRGSGGFGRHLDLRFGPVGPGLVDYRELGLETAQPDALAVWSSQCFGRGNAALAMSFAPPAGLSLPLGDGPRRTVPPIPHPLVSGSAWSGDDGSEHLMASGLFGSGATSALLEHVVSESVSKQLREVEHASYSTSTHVERLDNTTLMLAAQSDVLPERMGEAIDLLHRVVYDLAAVGPSPEVLERARSRVLRAIGDDPYRVWQAHSSALAVLRGDNPREHDAAVEVLRSASADTLHDDLASLSRSLLVTAPPGVESHTSLHLTDGVPPMDQRPVGPAIRHRDPGRTDTLRVDDLVVELTRGGHSFGVRLDTAVALLVYADGAHSVVGRAGNTVMVEPQMWRGGDTVVRRLAAVVPPSKHVPMPARDAAYVGAPMTGARRARALASSLALRRPVYLTVSIVLSLVLAAGSVAAGYAGAPVILLASFNVFLWVTTRDSHPGGD